MKLIYFNAGSFSQIRIKKKSETHKELSTLHQ